MEHTLPLEQVAVRLSSWDDVAVVTTAIPAGTRIAWGETILAATCDIPRDHKIALREIPAGEAVRKYGEIIGRASRRIAAGDHVHTHNLETDYGEREIELSTEARGPSIDPELARRTFLGYARPDGRAGTRNYILVIATVNCSATVARKIADHFTADALAAFPQVDGVVAMTHKHGCAHHAGGEHHRQLERTLAGFARNPNTFAYLFVGLGCETNAVERLLADEGFIQAGEPIGSHGITIQDLGGTRPAVAEGIRRIEEILPRANECVRTPVPVSRLTLGTECGGSDANSGITANPALGAAADLLVRSGGTVILSEVPEIFGAERLLARRAASPQVGEKLLERIRWWRSYAGRMEETLDDNLAPGNIAGGLTTIVEKSLGAIAKGGRTDVVDVVRYAQRVEGPGLVVMDTPGYDPMSLTGLVAGGANVIGFTTGRGSVYGCKPAPSIKIASTTGLYERMAGDMDINAGTIREGRSVEDVGREIFEEIIAVASGKRTKSETHGMGEEEFAPWVIGATF